MVDENLQFKNGNPGAVQYGNFINYYKFHPPNERINLLPKHIWEKPCVALDVGCNSGDLTVSLWDFLSENVCDNSTVLGVDIDPILITRAKNSKKDKNVHFCQLDIMDETEREHVLNSFLAKIGACTFSVVFCFSTTMWIHLNYGDHGLKAFLKFITSICDMLVIEPQPWKCYKTALKRMKQVEVPFPLFPSLKMRGDVEKDIETYLCNECNLEKVTESARTVWNRKLLIFRSKH